jgi:hypothetical protein
MHRELGFCVSVFLFFYFFFKDISSLIFLLRIAVSCRPATGFNVISFIQLALETFIELAHAYAAYAYAGDA